MRPDTDIASSALVRGRCYCAASTVRCTAPPINIAYCHCDDCKRVTGSPVAAFAAFDEDTVAFTPVRGAALEKSAGVKRWFCHGCGSPLAACFAYLPGQIYLPIGILDEAEELAPTMHAHANNALPWLCLTDALPRTAGSARAALAKGG